MKKIAYSFIIAIMVCSIVGCSSDKKGETNSENIIESESLTSNSDVKESTENSQSADLSLTLGISIELPENENWINHVEYSQSSQNYLLVRYYDEFLQSDCQLTVAKDDVVALPEITFDESQEKTWEGNTGSGDIISVKVQYSKDKEMVFATWTYNNYEFAIQGNAPDQNESIPKTALYIIGKL